MQKNKIESFIISHKKYFPAEKIRVLYDILEKLDDKNKMMLYSMEYKDPTNILLVSVLAGRWGVDRFLIGDIPLGILKLLTFGGCGIWSIIDMCTILDKVKEFNFENFQKSVAVLCL